MALQEKRPERKQPTPPPPSVRRRDGSRSGFETGWRLAHLVIREQVRRDPEGFVRFVLSLDPMPSETPILASGLDVEPSLVRRMFRHLHDVGCANVIEMQRYGTPPVKIYSSCLEESMGARRRVAAG